MAGRLPRLPKDLSLVDKLGRVSVEFQRWWQKAMEGIENILLDLQEAIDRITTNETDIAGLEAVTFTASGGLTGGGGILTNPSFAVGAGTGIVVDADEVSVSAKLAAYHGGDTPSAFTLGIVDSADAAAWRTAIGAGTSSTTGTVTSVAATVPTGFSIAGSPVTTSGTLAISYTAGYQGYTTTEATKLGLITSGTYTPTLTNVNNVASSSATLCMYSRNGDVVTVSGNITVTATASSASTVVGISLPIASAFTDVADARGCGASAAAQQSGAIEADSTNDRAQMRFISVSTGALGMFFTFQYRVL